MSLLNPALLAGLGLVVIPVLLHLLMRAKPKRIIFPALRLIQARRKQNSRRMRLRHLWLLILRMLVIALIVLAVARPSLPAANYSLSWFEIFMLLVTLAATAGAYFGVMELWKKKGLSRNEYLTRRTVLRGACGIAFFLLTSVGVAWPYSVRVFKEVKDPAPRVSESVPVAAVFLFDTSPSMGYKQASLTRLDEAKKFAISHLGRLPSGSKVSSTSSADTQLSAFSVDLKAAQSRIESQEIRAKSMPLNERLRSVLIEQEDDRRRVTSEQGSIPEDKRKDRFVREVYLFTDLAKSGWRDESSSFLKDELERLKWIGLYVIDVGSEEPLNVALHSLKLSREAIPSGGFARLDAVVSSVGKIKPDQTIELLYRRGDGPPITAGKESVTLSSAAEAKISFQVEAGATGYRQGEIRLNGSDPMNADDVLSFTLQTIPPIKVLVAAEDAATSAQFVKVLKSLTDSNVTAYAVEAISVARLREKDLSSFDVVCLINANAPTDATWAKMKSFVESGGGLAVFVGAKSAVLANSVRKDLIDQVAYNREAALAVLPAALKASLQFSPAQTLDVRNSRHLLLQRIEELGALSDLGLNEFRRYWKVDPVADAVTIVRYGDANGPVAMVERRIGEGRVVMVTTSVDGIEWNDLLDPNSGAMIVVLADQLMQYLSRRSSGRFNDVIGAEMSFSMAQERKPRKVVVRMPDYKQRLQDVPNDASILNLKDLDVVGSYSVDAIEKDVDFHAGFSLNLPAAESDLSRQSKDDLNRLLGPDRYSISRDPAMLERNVQAGRVGLEMYSFVLAILIVVFATEQFTATWFYRTDDA